jgi:hypothetical protein
MTGPPRYVNIHYVMLGQTGPVNKCFAPASLGAALVAMGNALLFCYTIKLP